jgi:hypothetical protein
VLGGLKNVELNEWEFFLILRYKLTKEVEKIFKEEKEENLRCHGLDGGEGNLVSGHSEKFSHRLEQEDDRELDSNV